MPANLEPRIAAFVTLTLVVAFVLSCRAVRKLGNGYGYIPSAKLLRSLIANPREDEEWLDVRVRQITCWQIIIGFIGIGGAVGWLLTLALRWLCEWSGGSAVGLLASLACEYARGHVQRIPAARQALGRARWQAPAAAVAS